MTPDQKKEKIEELINQAYDAYEPDSIEKSISLLNQAWEFLPEDKTAWNEGYKVVKNIIETYFYSRNLSQAEKWIDIFLEIDKKQRDYGEAPFLSAKILFDLGDLSRAKELIQLANAKSGGRCFSDEDPKYKKLLNENEIRPTDLDGLIKLSESEFAKKNYSYALSLLFDCTNLVLDNAKVHLRKGQCHWELQEFHRAADSLTRAYMLEGESIFQNQDPKYFEFLKTKIKI